MRKLFKKALRDERGLTVYNRSLCEFAKCVYILKDRTERKITKLQNQLSLAKKDGFTISNKFEKENLLKESELVYKNVYSFIGEFDFITGTSLKDIYRIAKIVESKSEQTL